MRKQPASTYKKLNPFRVAAGFEKLRLETEKFVSSGNKRPAVFLLTFGNLCHAQGPCRLYLQFLWMCRL